LPRITLGRAELEAGVPVAALLQESGLATSRSEGRRLIRGGGARLNGATITDEHAKVRVSDMVEGSLTLAAGRNRHVIISAV
jgi:tyrosyl-tRNA synthetase